MENYYFLDGDHRHGPYSLDQLKTYPISEDTPIWKDSRMEWIPAMEVEELRGYVVAEVAGPVRRKEPRAVPLAGRKAADARAVRKPGNAGEGTHLAGLGFIRGRVKGADRRIRRFMFALAVVAVVAVLVMRVIARMG